MEKWWVDDFTNSINTVTYLNVVNQNISDLTGMFNSIAESSASTRTRTKI